MFILEIFLFVSLFCLLCFCVIVKNNTSLFFYNNSNFFSLLIIFFAFILLKNSFDFFYADIHFLLTDFVVFIKFIVLFNFFIVFILSFFYTFTIFEFSTILLMCLFSIFLLLSSIDLIGIYLLLELQSFCFYILTSLKTNSNLSLEAALKYFILGSVISGLFIFGVSLLYGILTLTNLYDIKLFFEFYNFEGSFLLNIAVGLILISLLFKLGIIPFHMYIPDVYIGAPTIVMILFILIQKLVIISVFVLFYYTIFMYFNLDFILFGLILITLFFGSLFTIAQSQIKKLLVYSSIVNSGFILCCILLGNIEGFIATFFYLFIYVILMSSFFIIFLSFIQYSSNMKLGYLRDFALLKNSNFILCVCLVIILFSLAGLPPLVGFFSKLLIFLSLSKSQSYILMFIILLFSLLIIYYYVRIVYVIFFLDSSYKFNLYKPVSKFLSYLVFPILFINIFFGFYAKFIINILEILVIKHFIYI